MWLSAAAAKSTELAVVELVGFGGSAAQAAANMASSHAAPPLRSIWDRFKELS
jgi:hypothetical protein